MKGLRPLSDWQAHKQNKLPFHPFSGGGEETRYSQQHLCCVAGRASGWISSSFTSLRLHPPHLHLNPSPRHSCREAPRKSSREKRRRSLDPFPGPRSPQRRVAFVWLRNQQRLTAENVSLHLSLILPPPSQLPNAKCHRSWFAAKLLFYITDVDLDGQKGATGWQRPLKAQGGWQENEIRLLRGLLLKWT